jgi:hypothetical protein
MSGGYLMLKIVPEKRAMSSSLRGIAHICEIFDYSILEALFVSSEDLHPPFGIEH